MTPLHQHLATVDRAARGMARRLPWHVELDDLRGEGHVGLVLALGRKAAEGERFDAYARICANGAMKDYLRRCDPASRDERELEKRGSSAHAKLGHKLGREPTLDEVADVMGVPVEKLHLLYASLPHRRPVAFPDDGEHEALAVESSPEDLLDRARQTMALEAAVARLPARTRRVLELYYQHDLSMLEVGREIGVSEARVCQIHKAAIAELRAIILVETRAA